MINMEEDTKKEIDTLKEEIKRLKDELKFHSHDGRGTMILNEILKLLPYIEGRFKTQGSVGITTTYLDADGKTITVKNGIII